MVSQCLAIPRDERAYVELRHWVCRHLSPCIVVLESGTWRPTRRRRDAESSIALRGMQASNRGRRAVADRLHFVAHRLSRVSRTTEHELQSVYRSVGLDGARDG